MRKHETRSNSKSYLSVIIHILTTKYILPFPYQTLRVCVQKCCEYAPIQGVSATPVCSKQLLFPFHHSFQRYQKNITYIVAGREEADRGGRGGGVRKRGGGGRGHSSMEYGGLYNYHVYIISSPIAAILLSFTQTPVSQVVAACTSNLLQVSISVFSSEATYHLKLFLKQSRFKMG